MRTHVYVDGFNVRAIKYFTTRVEARPGDPDQATRQDTYFRALQTLPGFELVLGQSPRISFMTPIAD